MPTFSDHPPLDPRGPSFQIVRTPTGKPLIGIITSESLVGTYTHFYKRRTIPCERSGQCEACLAGIPFRWHAYLSAYLQNRAHVLFECTAQAAERFVEYRQAHGTTRGCRFTASRMNYAPNARVIITCKPANLTDIILPQPPDIIKVLAILWDFPIPSLDATRQGTKPGQNTITHTKKPPRADKTHQPAKDDTTPDTIATTLANITPKPPTKATKP